MHNIDDTTHLRFANHEFYSPEAELWTETLTIQGVRNPTQDKIDKAKIMIALLGA